MEVETTKDQKDVPDSDESPLKGEALNIANWDKMFEESYIPTKGMPGTEDLQPNEEEAEEEAEEEVEDEEQTEEEADDFDYDSFADDMASAVVPDEEPEKPAGSYEDVVHYYEMHTLAEGLRKNGYKVGENLEGLKEAYNQAHSQSPLDVEQFRDKCRRRATQLADDWRQNVEEPYEEYQDSIRVGSFIRDMLADPDTADMIHYLDEMEALLPELERSKGKAFASDPVRALPILYMKAKMSDEKRQRGSRRNSGKSKPYAMEGGATRQNKGSSGKREASPFDVQPTKQEKLFSSIFSEL